jgi:glyoxylase-like metal-dependent hydrolase (beta-lactamase superfamily II)
VTAPRVVAIRYAARAASKSTFFLRYYSYGEPDAPQSLDYYFWVVGEGPDALVVDTGFHVAVGASRGRTCLCPPLEALVRLGVEPASVSRLLLTHFHYDHVGNVDAFPAAELLVPERELRFWTGPMASRAQFAEVVEPVEIARIAEAHRAGRARTMGARTDVAPGIIAIDLGGHSPGQQIVVVETDGGPVVLASDAVHLYEEFERDRPFEIVADLADMYRAYDAIREICRRPGAVMVPGHDPEVMRRFPPVDGPAGEIAVQIA